MQDISFEKIVNLYRIVAKQFFKRHFNLNHFNLKHIYFFNFKKLLNIKEFLFFSFLFSFGIALG